MNRFFLAALFLATSLIAAPKRGVAFKDNPTTNLGTVQAGVLYDIDLRTLLVTPGIPPLTWVQSGMPSWLTLNSATNRLSGTPSTSQTGVFNFRMSVSDSSGESGIANHAMQITVIAPPKWTHSPVDLGLQNEDKAWSVNLNSVVTNPTGGGMTFTIAGQPSWMSLNGSTGVLSGTPKRANVGKYNGITLTAIGSGGSAAVAAFGEVLKTVKPPKWTSSQITLTPNPSEDQAYSRSLLEFVTNPEGTALSYEIVSQSLPAWLSIGSSTAMLSGLPLKANLGVGSLSVTLRTTIDGVAYEDSTVFKYEVLHVNHPPKWVADPLPFPNGATGVGYNQSLKNSFTDVDAGDTHKFELVPGGPAWLKLDSSTGQLSGSPAKGDAGTFTWKVKVTDQATASDTTTLSITVIKSNDPPAWVSKPTLLKDGAEDAAYEVDLNQVKYVVDPDSDPISFTKLSGPAWATVSSQGKLVGKPGKNDIGIAKIQVRAADGISGSDVAEIQIAVIATNHAPFWMASPLNFTTKEDAPMNLDLAAFAKDPDNDTPLSFSLLQGPPWAKLSALGALTGTPKAAQLGVNNFKVRVADPKGLSADVDVVVTVQHVNHRPEWTVNPIVLPNAKEDQAYSAILSGFAQDVDAGDILSFSVVEGPAWAKVGASGVLTGVPGRLDVGLNTLRVRVMDPYNEFSDVTVQVTVEKVNHAPRWRQNPILMTDGYVDEAYSFNLAPFAVDDDGDVLKFRVVSGPTWMKVAENGLVTGTPLKADKGPFNAVFEVTDTKSPGVSTNVNGTILQKNKPPVISPELPTFIVKERSLFKVNLNQPQYISDPDGDTLNFVLLDAAPWVTLSQTGELIVNKPAFKDIGLHTFKLKVDDGKVATNGTLSIQVIRDPRAPVWIQDPIRFIAKTNEPFSESLVSWVQDLDGIPITFSKKTGKPWLSAASSGQLSGEPKDADLGSNAFVVSACNDLLCSDAGVFIDVQWGTKEEKFATDDAVSGARADTLWVVDNSQQCDSLVTSLKKNANVFFDALNKAKVSHAGIYLSADAHKWDGMPIRDTNQPRLFRWTDTNLVADFLKRVDLSYSPGSCSNCYNSPLWSMSRFYEHAPDLTDVYHQGYLDGGVPMDAMIVTQQMDHYKWYTKYIPEFVKFTPEDYAKRFQEFHAKEASNLRVSAIAPQCPSLIEQTGDKSSYGPDNSYRTVVDKTAGTYYTVNCNFDVASYLKDYAAKIVARAYLWGHKSVNLSKNPVETQSMKVWLGDTPLQGNSGAATDQWRYEPATNAVRIYWNRIDTSAMKPRDKIRVTYRVS